MSEKSGAQPSVRKGLLKPWKVRSVLTRARRVVFLSFGVLVVICVAAIGSWRIQSAQIDYLFLTIDPVMDSNIEIFRDMSIAQSEILQYQYSQNPEWLNSFRAKQIQIEAELVQLSIFVEHLRDNSENEVDQRLVNLVTIQSEAVERWMSHAQSIEDAVRRGQPTISSTEIVLFEGFNRVSSELDGLLKLERTRSRANVRSVGATGALIVTIGVVVAAIIGLVFGLRLARVLTKPVIELSDTMRRHREGDLNARAIENQDSLETRDLARDFNLLAEHGAQLEQTRSLAKRMHELTVKIEHCIRDASNTAQALEILCVELGTGLDVDRVLTNTVNADLQPMLSTQWHRSELPPLGDLPDEFIPLVGAVAEELWSSSSHIVSNDRLPSEAQNERSKAFYRYTGARAAIVVPVGLGEQVIGMIYVVTTTEPRDWTEAEVNAVDRVAAFLAQFVVEQTYRDQLNEHVERLEQLNRQKDTFVATVSHELRTPLTSIIGYLEVLKDGYAGDLTEEQARMLDVMDRNAIRLLGLIQDLLALNKRESEAGKIELANVSMPELITKVCQELSPLAESGAIKVECDAGPPSAVVQGDRGKLQSAVVNIVSNAIKFSPRGAVVTIGSTVDESKRRVQFTCQDRGMGIPTVDQGELFTRFYRASNAMTKFIPGTGLGLTIVKQIVEDHGGEIRLTSVEGEGTTVVIDLPLSPQDSF